MYPEISLDFIFKMAVIVIFFQMDSSQKFRSGHIKFECNQRNFSMLLHAFIHIDYY